MRIHTIAMNDRSVYLAKGGDKEFYLFTQMDNRPIRLQDELEGDFDDDGKSMLNARNLSTGGVVRIYVEQQVSSVTTGMARLKKIGSPSKVFTAEPD